MSAVKVATPLTFIVSGVLIDIIKVEAVIFIGSLITLIYFIIIRGRDISSVEVARQRYS